MSDSKSASGFSINLPEGWSDQTLYTYKGPDDSGVQHNLLVQVDNELEIDDLARYAQEKIGAMKNTLSGFELLSEKKKKLKTGPEAYEAVYKWSPGDGKVIFQKQVYVIFHGKAYNFTASFSKKTLQTIGTEVDGIIDSFRLG
jgi:hypothetical protein